MFQTESDSRYRLNYSLFVAFVVIGLYFTTRINYLLFHSIVELFSIVIASTVFIITWNSAKYIKNPYLIMVGISYLFIATLDTLHTLAYKGMPIFTDYDYYANQLWIAARYLESSTLLIAFIMLLAQKRVKAGFLFICYFVATSLLVASIFYWKVFPICFVAGKGLTPFKVYSEYLICGILGGSMYLLTRNRRFFSDRVYKLIMLSLMFAIVSELAFTFYIDNYGISNLVGHYFKLFSFLLIYHAIACTGIEDPYHFIFQELVQANELLRHEIDLRKKTERENELALIRRKETEAALKELNEELEKRVEERTAELREKDQLLLTQGRRAAMGEMIGNIAHQWRQPLNSLGLLVQEVQLVQEVGEADLNYLAEYSQRSMKLIHHMSRTIDDFRNFFKPDKEKVNFDVEEVVRKTLQLLEGTLKEQGIAVEVDTAGESMLLGYPNEFSQVLLNILNNARDVLRERKVAEPRIGIGITGDGGKVCVTIRDNAGGIPVEIIDRIFDPYFTTKGPESGTGVGLSMSKSIVDRNFGGLLSARNVSGGAEFTVEVASATPVAGDGSAEPADAPAAS
jgi:signal transduction histidine kinase